MAEGGAESSPPPQAAAQIISQTTDQTTQQPTVSTAPEQTNEQPSEQPSITPAVPFQDAVMMPDPAFMNGNPEFAQFDPSNMMNGYPMTFDPTFMSATMDSMQYPMMQYPMMQMAQVPQIPPITADEIALYDRQIRLWGVQAQEKIRSANILLVGMKALGTEIAKNLVLAGVGTLTILDSEIVTEDDLGAQFLLSQDQIGQNRAQATQAELQKLNPRVTVIVDTSVISTQPLQFFAPYSMTIVTGQPLKSIETINKYTNELFTRFYAADLHGMYGYIFSDLGTHTYSIEKEQSNKPTKQGRETETRSVLSVVTMNDNQKKIESVIKQELFTPFILAHSGAQLQPDLIKTASKRKKVSPLIPAFRALLDFRQAHGRLPEHNREDLARFATSLNAHITKLQLPGEIATAEFLRSFIQNLGTELAPSAAYLGGYLAQDVINVLGEREQPLQNFLFFDGETCSSNVYSLQYLAPPDMEMTTDMNTMHMNGSMAINGTGMSGDTMTNGTTNGMMTTA